MDTPTTHPSDAAGMRPLQGHYPEKAHLAALFGVALILTAIAVKKPLWNNDFITLKTVALSLPEIVYERIENNHMPVYFIALQVWTRLFGQGEAALRFISGLFSLASVAMIWLIARRAWGPRTAIVAGWIGALSSYLLYSASQARMYTMLEFLTLASMYYYLRLLAGAGRRTWALYFGVHVLGLATHLLYGLTILVQLVHILAARKTSAIRASAVWAVSALAWLPLAPFCAYWMQRQYFVGQAEFRVRGPGVVIRHIMKCLWGEFDFDLWNKDVSRALGALLMLLALGLLFKTARSARARLRARTPRQADAQLEAFLPWWFLIPVATLYLGSLRTDNALNSLRYYGTAIAAGPLVAAGAWHAMRSPRWRAFYLAGALTLCAWYSAGFLIAPGSGLRQAVAHIAENIGQNEEILAVDRSAADRAFVYYGLRDSIPPALNKRDKRDQVQPVLDRLHDEHDGLWVVLYHEGDTPVVRMLESDERFEKASPSLTIGETQIYHYRVVAKGR